jgi:hypothetical protein
MFVLVQGHLEKENDEINDNTGAAYKCNLARRQVQTNGLAIAEWQLYFLLYYELQ